MSNFKTISGLKGFCYYDVDDQFQISRVDSNKTRYFKDEILDKNVEWFKKAIKDRFEENDDNISFDSGVICATEEQLKPNK